MELIRTLIEDAAFVIEVLAVAVILVAVALSTLRPRLLMHLVRGGDDAAYEQCKHQLGRALLLGLELLVAADVVRTIVLEPTLDNITVLALLVAVRTFLSWSMVVEIEGRWPWQARSPRIGHIPEEDA